MTAVDFKLAFTVKPFILAALKLATSHSHAKLFWHLLCWRSSNTRVMPIKVGILSIFTPFNFAVLF